MAWLQVGVVAVCGSMLFAAPGVAAGAPESVPGARRPCGAAPRPAVEAAFAPEGGAETLILKLLGSASASIRLAGYTFTSPTIVKALLAAKRRGVDVALVVDHRNNLEESRSGASRRALNLLARAGVSTRTSATYALHHDKYIVVDERHVETGSFNYTIAAARWNSENVLVVWHDPQLAARYLAHWRTRWARGLPYRAPPGAEYNARAN